MYNVTAYRNDGVPESSTARSVRLISGTTESPTLLIDDTTKLALGRNSTEYGMVTFAPDGPGQLHGVQVHDDGTIRTWLQASQP